MNESFDYPIDKPTRTEKVQRMMRRHEGFLPPASFVIGFTYHTFTLKRVDLLFDNLVLLGYLLLSSIALIIIGRIELRHTKREFLIAHQDWFKVLLHLCMGSLFSAYTILYFKSAAVGQSYIFVVMLILILLVNEFVRHGLSSLKMLSVLQMFCSFAFFTFFLPVMTKRMDFDTFLQGGVLSLGLTGFIWLCIFGLNTKNLWREKFGVFVPPIVLFGLMCGVYVLNWIPPSPYPSRKSEYTVVCGRPIAESTRCGIDNPPIGNSGAMIAYLNTRLAIPFSALHPFLPRLK